MASNKSFVCHMDILLADGSVAESSKATGKPMRLNLGDSSLSAQFESQIETLVAGDKHRFTLEARDAFGESNPDAIHHMERAKFSADMTLESGVIVSFAGPAGSEIPGMVREVVGDSVTVDLNHPLAGQAVTFELEVLQVL